MDVVIWGHEHECILEPQVRCVTLVLFSCFLVTCGYETVSCATLSCQPA
jgi:hypothetical protein